MKFHWNSFIDVQQVSDLDFLWKNIQRRYWNFGKVLVYFEFLIETANLRLGCKNSIWVSETFFLLVSLGWKLLSNNERNYFRPRNQIKIIIILLFNMSSNYQGHLWFFLTKLWSMACIIYYFQIEYSYSIWRLTWCSGWRCDTGIHVEKNSLQVLKFRKSFGIFNKKPVNFYNEIPSKTIKKFYCEQHSQRMIQLCIYTLLLFFIREAWKQLASSGYINSPMCCFSDIQWFLRFRS